MSKITQNTIIETFSSYKDLCNLYLIIDAAQQPEKITDFIRQKYGKTNLIFHSLFAGTQEGNVPFAEGTTVYADKGYDSKENRQHLKEHQLLDGIMRKAHRNRPLTEVQTKRNRYLSKTRYVVEQSFGTLHRKFRYARAAYFGLCKVSAQSHLKAMCLNLLKAANRLSVSVAA